MSIYKPGRPSKYDPFTGKGSPPPSAPGEYRIRDAASWPSRRREAARWSGRPPTGAPPPGRGGSTSRRRSLSTIRR